jgi:acyl-CoA reductase-like NAD-dependent aldehyde dehydrogenase
MVSQLGTERKPYGLYIGGQDVAAPGDPTLPVVNPTTGETWATIVDARPQEVNEAVQAAREAFHTSWAATSPGTRAQLLHRLADVIEDRAAELAEIDMGEHVPRAGAEHAVRRLQGQRDRSGEWGRGD